MQTGGAINSSPKTGDIVTIWGNEFNPPPNDFQMNDPADGINGAIFYTGTWANADGTNGALFFFNLATIAGNSIAQVEVQGLFGNAYVTVITFATLAAILNALGTFIFQVQPGAASAGNYAGSSQDAIPNVGRLKITLTANTPKVSGVIGMQTTW